MEWGITIKELGSRTFSRPPSSPFVCHRYLPPHSSSSQILNLVSERTSHPSSFQINAPSLSQGVHTVLTFFAADAPVSDHRKTGQIDLIVLPRISIRLVILAIRGPPFHFPMSDLSHVGIQSNWRTRNPPRNPFVALTILLVRIPPFAR